MNARLMNCITAFLPPFLPGLLALALLTSCASSGGDMNAFVGQPSSELLARLGPPKLRIPQEQGGQVWTYVEATASTSAVRMSHPGAFNSSGSGSGPSAHASALDNPAFTSRREFFIDASGMIYKYRGKGR